MSPGRAIIATQSPRFRKGKNMSEKNTINFLEKLEKYRAMELEALKNLDLNSVNTVLNILETARTEGRRIFICGNGGSAATASHYAGDFNKGVNVSLLDRDNHNAGLSEKARNEKPGVPLYNFECLNDNLPTMLAVANDDSYAEVFRYPLSVKLQPGDIVIGISGSGNSANVVNALSYAKENSATTIAIVGYDGGKMKKMADYCIHVEIDDMQVSEDIHMVLDHMMMWVLTH